jgi:hypothetical protein
VPPMEPVFKTLMDFLKAPSWDASRRIVNAHEELINTWVMMVDTMLTDPATVMMLYPRQTRSDAIALLKTHRAVLVRCQQVGVAHAFAEMG